LSKREPDGCGDGIFVDCGESVGHF
jgi:hypothetical protein